MFDDSLISEPSAPSPTEPTDSLRVSADPGAAEQRAQIDLAAAFRAPAFTWKGEALKPFTVSREVDWQLHRHQIGAPDLLSIIGDVHAIAMDALRVIWFCLHEPEAWFGRAAGDVEKQIRAWADGALEGADINAAVLLFYEILKRARSTRATVKPDASSPRASEKKTSPHPASRRNTSASSRRPAPASSRAARSATSCRRRKAGATSTGARSRAASTPSGRTSATKTLRGSTHSARD